MSLSLKVGLKRQCYYLKGQKRLEPGKRRQDRNRQYAPINRKGTNTKQTNWQNNMILTVVSVASDVYCGLRHAGSITSASPTFS